MHSSHGSITFLSYHNLSINEFSYRFGNIAGAEKYLEKCFELMKRSIEEQGDAGRMVNKYCESTYNFSTTVILAPIAMRTRCLHCIW